MRWCALDEIVIVLDIATGEYSALDANTSKLWQNWLAGRSVDSHDFFNQVHRSGWIAEYSSVRRTRAIRAERGSAFLPLRAILCLLVARWKLRVRGFETAYMWAASFANIKPRTPSRTDLLTRAVRAFANAEALVPSRSGERDCLPRSLALFALLRSLGVSAHHVIGVARFPFDAHAWVEHDGEVILEFRVAQPLLPGAKIPKGRTPIAVLE